MSFQSTLHLSSCAHTPQQNGLVECKKKHLTEIAHTLLIHNHVPKRFCGYAIVIVCYSINHMPSLLFAVQESTFNLLSRPKYIPPSSKSV